MIFAMFKTFIFILLIHNLNSEITARHTQPSENWFIDELFSAFNTSGDAETMTLDGIRINKTD